MREQENQLTGWASREDPGEAAALGERAQHNDLPEPRREIREDIRKQHQGILGYSQGKHERRDEKAAGDGHQWNRIIDRDGILQKMRHFWTRRDAGLEVSGPSMTCSEVCETEGDRGVRHLVHLERGAGSMD